MYRVANKSAWIWSHDSWLATSNSLTCKRLDMQDRQLAREIHQSRAIPAGGAKPDGRCLRRLRYLSFCCLASQKALEHRLLQQMHCGSRTSSMKWPTHGEPRDIKAPAQAPSSCLLSPHQLAYENVPQKVEEHSCASSITSRSRPLAVQNLPTIYAGHLSYASTAYAPLQANAVLAASN